MTKETKTAVIAALPPTLAIIISVVSLMIVGSRHEKKIDRIHVLVNSRLSEALNEIKTLQTEVRRLKGK